MDDFEAVARGDPRLVNVGAPDYLPVQLHHHCPPVNPKRPEHCSRGGAGFGFNRLAIHLDIHVSNLVHGAGFAARIVATLKLCSRGPWATVWPSTP